MKFIYGMIYSAVHVVAEKHFNRISPSPVSVYSLQDIGSWLMKEMN